MKPVLLDLRKPVFALRHNTQCTEYFKSGYFHFKGFHDNRYKSPRIYKGTRSLKYCETRTIISSQK